MPLNTVEDIERAIDGLTPQQREELYLWLDRCHPQLMDARVSSDLQAGRLDEAIHRALDDERAARVRPL